MANIDGATVLVVEDEHPLRKLYAQWLAEEGCETRQAADGEEALEQWDDDVDAVLLDRRLPELYGDEVLEQARESGHETPVAMVTAVDPDLDLIDMEFDNYITKPIEQQNLYTVVEKLIRTTDIRDSVREFISVGVKVQKLSNQHPDELLSTHAEYQKLRKRYNDLLRDLEEKRDDLNDAERQALLVASKRLNQ